MKAKKRKLQSPAQLYQASRDEKRYDIEALFDQVAALIEAAGSNTDAAIAGAAVTAAKGFDDGYESGWENACRFIAEDIGKASSFLSKNGQEYVSLAFLSELAKHCSEVA